MSRRQVRPRESAARQRRGSGWNCPRLDESAVSNLLIVNVKHLKQERNKLGNTVGSLVQDHVRNSQVLLSSRARTVAQHPRRHRVRHPQHISLVGHKEGCVRIRPRNANFLPVETMR